MTTQRASFEFDRNTQKATSHTYIHTISGPTYVHAPVKVRTFLLCVHQSLHSVPSINTKKLATNRRYRDEKFERAGGIQFTQFTIVARVCV